MAPESPELHDLAGSELSAICFVRDYVELHFDGTILRSLSDPVVVTPAGRSTFPQAGSRDALCGLIGHVVDSAIEHRDRLALGFDTGAVVEVPKASRRAGPEVAQLVPSRDGQPDAASMITWENLLPTRERDGERHIASDELLALPSVAHPRCRERLLAELTGAREVIKVGSPVRATDLLPAYRVRLARWREEQAPPSTGLPELVDTLERLGDSDVFIAAHHGADTTFVLLLSADLDELLACAVIEPP